MTANQKIERLLYQALRANDDFLAGLARCALGQRHDASPEEATEARALCETLIAGNGEIEQLREDNRYLRDQLVKVGNDRDTAIACSVTANDDGRLIALISLAAAILVALLVSGCGPDEADPAVEADPEKRVAVDRACRLQADAWCEAFRGCYGLDCEIEFCEPAFTASCMAQRDEPIEVSKLLACLAAIDEQSCDVEEFELPTECVW